MSKRVTFCKAACSLNGSFKVSLLCDNVARSIRTIWPHNTPGPNESQVNHPPQWGSFEWKQRRSPQDCWNWNIDVFSGLEILLEKNTKKIFFIFSCMPLLVVHFKVTWTKLKGKFIFFFSSKFTLFFWSNPVTQFDFGLLVCCTFNWIYFQICEVFVKKIFCFWELSSFWKDLRKYFKNDPVNI